MNYFLDQPKIGKSDAWRYLLSLFLILFFWFILGALPTVGLTIFVTMDNDPDTIVNLTTGMVEGVPSLVLFVFLISSFWFLIAGLFVAVRLIHKRPFLSLITPYKKIDWKRFFQGFTLFFILVGSASLIEYFWRPENYVVTFDFRAFVPFLLFMVILIPIQTSAEELFFRGYLLQALGSITRNIYILSVVNGILFMLPHLTNPEVASGPVLLALFYFGFGFFLTYITIKDNRLELALGVHAANNLFAGIFVNYTNSVMKTESIFTVSELDPLFSVIALLVCSVVFYRIIRLRGDSHYVEEQVEAIQ